MVEADNGKIVWLMKKVCIKLLVRSLTSLQWSFNKFSHHFVLPKYFYKIAIYAKLIIYIVYCSDYFKFDSV